MRKSSFKTELKCKNQLLCSIHLEDLRKSADPFKRMGISKLLSAVKSEAEKLGLSMSQRTSKIRERNLKIVSHTFNKIGLVVPFDKKYIDLNQTRYRLLKIILLSGHKSATVNWQPPIKISANFLIA